MGPQPKRFHLLDLLRQGLEASPLLLRRCHSPRRSRGHSGCCISGPTERHSLGGASVFRREEDIWVEDAEGFPRGRSLVPVLATHRDQPGSWFALSNLGVFLKVPTDKSWACLTATQDWRSMHPMAMVIHDELRKPSTAAEKTKKIAANLRAKSRRRSVRKATELAPIGAKTPAYPVGVSNANSLNLG